MRFNQLKARLAALENKSGAQDVVLVFADGSARAVRCKDPLGAVIASFERIHAASTGEPQPTSASDGVLDLMAAADSLAVGSDPVLILAQQCAKEAVVTTPTPEVKNE